MVAAKGGKKKSERLAEPDPPEDMLVVDYLSTITVNGVTRWLKQFGIGMLIMSMVCVVAILIVTLLTNTTPEDIMLLVFGRWIDTIVYLSRHGQEMMQDAAAARARYSNA